jgi:iron(II)-dependent oxidoreductase
LTQKDLKLEVQILFQYNCFILKVLIVERFLLRYIIKILWVLLVSVWISISTGCSVGEGNDSLVLEIATPTIETPASRFQTATVEVTEISATVSPTITSTEGLAAVFFPELVFVPAGEFEMGADAQEGYQICLESREGCDLDDFTDESPKHLVYLSEYWIFKFEVTNDDYRECVSAGSCAAPAFMEFYNNDFYAQHPVVHVDWFSASDFCEWAGGRLPTEAEWEKAAVGTTGWIFPWGDEADCDRGNFSGCNFGEVTLPIGSYPDWASVYGVMDMAGNAAEWTADWYDAAYYADSAYDNPSGPEEGTLRSARGGSWKNPAVGVRSANRGGNYPEVFSSGVGFRCVLDEVP